MTRPTGKAPPRERVWHWVIVGGVAAAAFGTRALLLLTHPPALFPGSDNTWYDSVARSIEDGHLGRLPAVGGGRVLSIRFPPAYPVVLALGRGLLFWVDSHDAHLWVGAALGALLAVGALTRSEAIVVLGAAVVGGHFATRARTRSGRMWMVALAIGFSAAIAWSVVISVADERPVAMGTNSGSLLLGANCEQTRANSPDLGYWDVDCLSVPAGSLSAQTARRTRAQEEFLAHHFALPPQIGAPGEAEINSAQFDEATAQIADHPLDTVAEVPVRLLRGLGLYWSPLQDKQEYFEGRDHGWGVAGRWFTIVLVLPFALLTMIAVFARRSWLRARLRALVDARRLIPSLALMAAWAVTIVLSYGSARFRAVIEPSLAIFAALGITILVTALVQRDRTEPAS